MSRYYRVKDRICNLHAPNATINPMEYAEIRTLSDLSMYPAASRANTTSRMTSVKKRIHEVLTAATVKMTVKMSHGTQ
jgi:hypothetical protein